MDRLKRQTGNAIKGSMNQEQAAGTYRTTLLYDSVLFLLFFF